MADKVFANGMIVKAPRDSAPDYVICDVSIKIEEFEETIRKHGYQGWLNLSIKESTTNKLYAEVDTWRKDQGQGNSNQGQGYNQSQGGYQSAPAQNGSQPPPAPPAPPAPQHPEQAPNQPHVIALGRCRELLAMFKDQEQAWTDWVLGMAKCGTMIEMTVEQLGSANQELENKAREWGVYTG